MADSSKSRNGSLAFFNARVRSRMSVSRMIRWMVWPSRRSKSSKVNIFLRIAWHSSGLRSSRVVSKLRLRVLSTAFRRSAAVVTPPVWVRARVCLIPILAFSTSTTFSTTSTGVGASVAKRSITWSRCSGRSSPSSWAAFSGAKWLMTKATVCGCSSRIRFKMWRGSISAMACIAPVEARVVTTRPRTSLALKLPSAFSSVLRAKSSPAETPVLAARATSENSCRISSCCCRLIKVERVISRAIASTSRGSKRFSMTEALSRPSMTKSAASFWVLLSALLSGAAPSATCSAWSWAIALGFNAATLVHPFADGLSHIGRVFFYETIQDVHADDAGRLSRPTVSHCMTIAVRLLRGDQPSNGNSQLNLLDRGPLEKPQEDEKGNQGQPGINSPAREAPPDLMLLLLIQFVSHGGGELIVKRQFFERDNIAALVIGAGLDSHRAVHDATKLFQLFP